MVEFHITFLFIVWSWKDLIFLRSSIVFRAPLRQSASDLKNNRQTLQSVHRLLQSNIPQATTQNVKPRSPFTRAKTIMGQKDHNGSCPCVNIDAMFNSCKSQCREENPVLHIDKFPFLVLARNTIMLKHLIHFLLYYLSSGRLRKVKNKGKCQTFSSKSGRGRLREVLGYKRFQM